VKFSDYLKTCRAKNDLTQEQLVQALYLFDTDAFEGLSESTVGKWERGLTQPTTAKQSIIIHYFQKQTGLALPCWENYSLEDTEKMICKAGIHNLLGKSKKYVFDFPSDTISIDDLKVYPLRNAERVDSFIDANMLLHQSYNHPYTQIGKEHFKKWAMHPESFFLVCDYKGSYFGLFFSIKVKPEVFNRILNFQM
jgi:transcriptional regulator with XRE-family HTH domain